MQRLAMPALALLFLLAASDAAAQSFEVFGNVGVSQVDLNRWSDQNGVNLKKLAYGVTGQVIWGQAGPGGLQVSIEGGYQHYMSYEGSIQFNGIEVSEDGFRGAGIARIWVREGEMFLEGGMGAVFFDGFTDPSVAGGIGRIFGSDGGMRIPVKVRADAIFDGDAILAPITLSVGLHFGS